MISQHLMLTLLLIVRRSSLGLVFLKGEKKLLIETHDTNMEYVRPSRTPTDNLNSFACS